VLRLDQDITGHGQGSGGASGFLQELSTSGFHNASKKKSQQTSATNW
jgi:hypothetical protein